MVKNIRKNWEHDQIDLTATTSTYKVCDLRGGESVTIKAKNGNSGMAYIGATKDVSATTGYELDSSETLSLTLPISFGRDNYIEIWAVTDNAGDDVCFVKLFGLFPETES